MQRLNPWAAVMVGIAFLAGAQALAQTSSTQRRSAPADRSGTTHGWIGRSGDATASVGPTWELAGGYGFLAAFEDVLWGRWYGSTGIRIRNNLWTVGEFDGWRLRTSHSDYAWRQLLGGVRYQRRFGRVTPFARLLTGVERISAIEVDARSPAHLREDALALPGLSYWGASSWIVQAGGGVDVRLFGPAAVRLTADYGSLTPRSFRAWRITPSLVIAR